MIKQYGFLALLTFLFSLFASAQDITVINHYSDSTGLGKDASFFPTFPAQHTLLINYYEPIPNDDVGRLEKLIGNALSFYVDQLMIIENDKIVMSKSKRIVLKDLNNIVNDGIKYYNYKPLEKFPGFSKQIEKQLDLLNALDFSNLPVQYQNNKNARYYYLQKEINDLKLLLNIEIGNIQNEHLFQVAEMLNSRLSPDEQEKLLEQLGNMQLNDPLNPLEVEMSDEMKAILSSADEESLSPAEHGDFDLLFAMIKKNSERLDSIQHQLSNPSDVINQNIEKQIDGMRSMIYEFIQNGRAVSVNDLVPNLPDKVSINYSQGVSSLNLTQKMILNELIDILAAHPRLNILITGYADKVGTTSSNFLLSKKRATQVREFLLHRGIDDNRIILNYYGEKNAGADLKSDRRVDIQFFAY